LVPSLSYRLQKFFSFRGLFFSVRTAPPRYDWILWSFAWAGFFSLEFPLPTPVALRCRRTFPWRQRRAVSCGNRPPLEFLPFFPLFLFPLQFRPPKPLPPGLFRRYDFFSRGPTRTRTKVAFLSSHPPVADFSFRLFFFQIGCLSPALKDRSTCSFLRFDFSPPAALPAFYDFFFAGALYPRDASSSGSATDDPFRGSELDLRAPEAPLVPWRLKIFFSGATAVFCLSFSELSVVLDGLLFPSTKGPIVSGFPAFHLSLPFKRFQSLLLVEIFIAVSFRRKLCPGPWDPDP